MRGQSVEWGIAVSPEEVKRDLKREIGHVTRRQEQRAFAKFIKEYEERWRSRTGCAAGYVTGSDVRTGRLSSMNAD